MANNTRWVAGGGAGLTWTSCGFTGTDFNSLASGSYVIASSAITNGTPLDRFADVSFIATVGGTTTASSYFTLCLLPINRDASTYGDNVANGSTPAGAEYQVATVSVKSGVTSGNTVVGRFRGIVLPPTSFKWGIVNNLGVALNATAAVTLEYITYNENLNA